MQSGLSQSDRKLLWVGAAVTLLLSVATLTLAPATQANQSTVPSSYSSSPDGALAAYLVLQHLSYPVQRWEEPPTRLGALDLHAVYILAEPAQQPSSEERRSILDFVRRGGRVLLCGPSVSAFFPQAIVSSKEPGKAPVTLLSDLPSPFSRKAPRIWIQQKATWRKFPPEALALFGDERSPAIVLWPIGKGEVLWWTSATPLTNIGIAKESNLNLFLDALSAGDPVDIHSQIYWDEYFHGARSSLWSYAAGTPVKWGLLQLLILAFAVLFSLSRRWGPIVKSRPVSRLSPLEFVNTLGDLYGRAGATAVPIRVSCRHLRLLLTRRLSLPMDTPDSALALAANDRLGWADADLLSTLQSGSERQNYRPRSREALLVVQNIERYTARLAEARTPVESI